MEEINVIEFFDFEDTIRIPHPDGSNSLIEIPKLTQPNLIQLIDEHNKLVCAFKDYVRETNEEIKNIKQNIK